LIPNVLPFFFFSEYSLSFVTLTLLIHRVTWKKLLICHLTLEVNCLVFYCFIIFTISRETQSCRRNGTWKNLGKLVPKCLKSGKHCQTQIFYGIHTQPGQFSPPCQCIW
jgi:hypothetical protein